MNGDTAGATGNRQGGPACLPHALDIGQAIDREPWGPFQKMVLAITCLSFITDGLANKVLSIAIPALAHDWGLSAKAFAPVAGSNLIGIGIGTVVGGVLSDRLGRRTILIASALSFGFATIACAVVNSVVALTVLRLVDGIGIGGAIPSAISLISELTPGSRRARAISLAFISVAAGGLVCGLIGSYVLPAAGWQALFIVNGMVALISAVILLFALPESPRYLIRREKRRAELVRVLSRVGIEVSDSDTLTDTTQLPRGPRTPVTMLFHRPYLLTTLGLWGAFMFGFLTVYTALTWIPSLLAERGFTLGVSSAALTAWSIGGMLGALLGAALIERVGSRAALMGLAWIGAASTIALAVFPLDPRESALPFLAGVTIIGVCLSGYSGCLYALAAHVYPPQVRATGIGASGMVGRVGSVVSTFAAVAALAMGQKQFFIFAGVSGFVSGAFLLLIVNHIPRNTSAGKP